MSEEKHGDGTLGLLMAIGWIGGGVTLYGGSGALIGLGAWCAVVLIYRKLSR
jgi:hypothetical protein